MSDTVVPLDRAEKRTSKVTLTRREQIRMLKEENERLKALVGLNEPVDEHLWGEYATQEMRDTFAANALIDSGLHPVPALLRLGFSIEDTSDPHWKQVARNIFETPGVKAILHADAAKFAGSKDKVLSSLYGIVVNPLATHADRTRAAQQLSRMIEGWQDGEKNKNPALVMNFLQQLMGGGTPHPNGNGAVLTSPAELPPGQGEIIDAEEFFVEPSEEAVAVIDEPK
jgi:hypothetical protein